MTSTTDESVRDRATDFEAVADRVRSLNDQLMQTARTAGTDSLDAYEKALSDFVRVQRQIAGATRLDWVDAVVKAQTSFLTEISAACTTAAREALK